MIVPAQMLVFMNIMIKAYSQESQKKPPMEA